MTRRGGALSRGVATLSTCDKKTYGTYHRHLFDIRPPLPPVCGTRGKSNLRVACSELNANDAKSDEQQSRAFFKNGLDGQELYRSSMTASTNELSSHSYGHGLPAGFYGTNLRTNEGRGVYCEFPGSSSQNLNKVS